MLLDAFADLYRKLRLIHYRSIFGNIREKEGSLSATEAYAADAIYLLDKPTIKQFSDYLGISQPNATYKINSLMAKGYINKIVSNDDKREFNLHVTEKFHKYHDDNTKFLQAAADKLCGMYSQVDIKKFAEMLGTLKSLLE